MKSSNKQIALSRSERNSVIKSDVRADKIQLKKDSPEFSKFISNRTKPDAPQKNWWIHIWSGLVLEKQAKHYKAIRQAIWLYLYFLIVANRQTGRLYRRLSTVASETGFHPRSIARWLKHLRETGYIETYSTGRFLHIAIAKWKPLGKRSNSAGQSGKARTNVAVSIKNPAPYEKFG